MTQNRKTKSIIILLGMSLMLTACGNQNKQEDSTKPVVEQEASQISQSTQNFNDSENDTNNANNNVSNTDNASEDRNTAANGDASENGNTAANGDASENAPTNGNTAGQDNNSSDNQTQESVLSSEIEELFNRYIQKEEPYENYLKASNELIDTFRSAKTESKKADRFAGTWNRTDCWNSCGGEIDISDMTSSSFLVNGDFYYYSHSGCMENGSGYFIDDTKAVAEVASYDGEEICLILFDFSNGLKTVAVGGESFGFGANVSLDGSYTLDEPVYTNANALEENFTQEDQQTIKVLFTENELDYDDRFLFPVQYGQGDKEETNALFTDGSSKHGTWYSYFIPTMGGYEFELFIADDGMIYWQGYTEFLSNDDNADNMPQKEQ